MIPFFTNHLNITIAENQHATVRASRPVDPAPVTSSGWYEFETPDGERFHAELNWRSGQLITAPTIVKTATDAMRRRFAVDLGASVTKENIDRAIKAWIREQEMPA